MASQTPTQTPVTAPLQVVRDAKFRGDEWLLAQLAEVAAPSYEDPLPLLRRDWRRCDTLYLVRDKMGLLAGFYLTGLVTLEAEGVDVPTLFLGMSALRQDKKRSGLAGLLYAGSLADAMRWEEEHGERLVMWGTTMTPTVYLGVWASLADVNPRPDGNYLPENTALAAALRNWLAAPKSQSHPFVLKGIAQDTRYSPQELARVERISCLKEFRLFEDLGVDRTAGDRALFICRVPGHADKTESNALRQLAQRLKRESPIALDELHNPLVLANPYPLYQRLRQEQPVYWRERSGAWFVTRYADVAALLGDPRLSAATLSKSLLRFAGLSQLDPPDHTRLRKIASSRFMAKAHETFPEEIQEVVDDLLGEQRRAESLDIMQDFATVLPTLVNARLLGVPVEHRDQWKQLTQAFGASFGSVGGQNQVALLKRTRQLLRLGIQKFRDVLAERRSLPKNDLLSALGASQVEGLLSEDEVIALCLEMLFAGQETTTNLIGNGLLALLQHPEQLRFLRDDETLMERAIEEMLRYDSAVQMTVRVARESISLHGKTIEWGQKVVLCLGSANRDSAQFAHPDQFDINRRHNRHLAFGYGPHYCLGAALARLTAQIAFSSLLKSFPNLRLASGELQWQNTPVYRGLKSLPVDFD